jgi:AcrR family transcriptional regulator
MAQAKRGRPKSLSREIILDAAFRVVDADAMNDLTMSRLGRELDADPSAVYRHFRNKDELLLAMADVMLEESIQAYTSLPATDDPVERLRRMCWTLRRSYLRRPGLARFVYFRFTGGEAEEASVRTMLRDMHELGYSDDESIALARGVAEMTLGHISMTADSLALPRKAQSVELEMARTYYTYDYVKPPVRSEAELREAQLADGELVFSTMLETYLAGVVAGAPAGARARKATSKRGAAAAPRATAKRAAARVR